MKTALFISPHLDDVAFSCGGTLVKLAGENWRTILVTIFTKSVVNPTSFALACQTDKGLSAEVDYMKLRRAEDINFSRIANAAELFHLDFAEAPHRGYNSAPELFAGIKSGDEIWRDVGGELNRFQADRIFAPQGIGNHVDHLQTIKAVLSLNRKTQVFWYRDTPYAIRNPKAAPTDLLPKNLIETASDVSQTIEQKIAGCAVYTTQINFQFGGAEKLKVDLQGFHQAEARRTGRNLTHAEVFLTEKSI